MSILVNKDSKVIFQGFTGQHATFHAQEAIRMGTQVVGGVTPGKGGQTHIDRPVFDTVKDAVEQTGADVSVVFVPPAFTADAVMEAIDGGIKVIVVITDGVPVQDMVRVKRYLIGHDTIIVGPNTAGVITPEACKVGIMPAHIYRTGRIGVVSRSGTLNYEAVEQMSELGLGISTSISIGGDPVNGCDFLTLMKQFAEDDETDAVLMIGEIGGSQEVEAATWARDHMDKPLIGFIAGATAPPGRTMGHAGAIISGEDDTAQAKMKRLAELDVHVVQNAAEIGRTVQQSLEPQECVA
ncbi:MAG: succinate--CoA ligase subunit alpha [Candidatus Thiodiazotropha lotti]|uniref:Succinate--CoA ligase [ADP-forming] subunit alpha n=1 Tax=Candidatus Thiodiazotropha endoloripes TaxID=1818881 RepID=A0A1E2UGY8_9GAMM|nr:succinate--CoA ligase subunit alpha [Candidatus Thiodiazotropha endoloripes]MCG7897422.1 succinate--CoA ligase subunit alpha [Candidatus Thiodiazotropha weberae]MCG7992953.1 succinate--CoA ligase subunit alpha [Candidatus Thiodiazotropha lotti]MCG7904149.1 succinate--CoA ligase subunit alpha [Candidatus Thiodiazotropha weberae]MCG7915835.1 succinate--CoA ligase subunit alpha [Candidatus Thiodiazotropha weberae]MCG8000704.1 succinate--CoA ligase subunit alpha [Candidatus Thiodiazotropha lott